VRRIIVTFMLATLVAVAVAGGAWVLVAPSPAMAEFPGHNGRIAFHVWDSDGFLQTWVANRDLSNQVKLTSESADSGWAVWKPGGAKLAFDSTRADPDPTDSEAINDIFTMNPDGSGVVKLTDSKYFDANAGWSPDGKRIAFDSDRRNHHGRQEIYVMDADGSNVSRVTPLPAKAEFDQAARFSPDGRRLVFTRYWGNRSLSNGRVTAETAALFTVRLDGSGLRRLTSWGLRPNDADWSPDGTKIVFEAYPRFPNSEFDAPSGSHGEVYTMDADGGHLKNITDNFRHAGSSDPVWSPDGKKILFLSAHVEGGEFGIGLATMNPDGSARQFISPSHLQEVHQQDWESVP
jgi:Tol biopolymer transport system component